VADPILEGLALDMLAVKGRQDDQERVLNELGHRLGEIAEILGAQDPAFLLSPWWWPTMLRGEAHKAWEVLVKWVDEIVIVRYDGGEAREGELPEGKTLQKCWFAHPVVVDKLSALWWAWRGAYRRHAPANGPHEFQHLLIVRTFEQIKLTSCLGGCKVLGIKSGDVTWNDRTAWVRDDIARRPIGEAP
jgi:hypothetical protein